MEPYTYKDGRFIIENYDEQKPFASFLPGVAGLDGIPMWVYYTNRGQGIACFGIENKDGAILDFVPANVAYKRTELQGYRTFIRVDGKISELFSSVSEDDFKRRMVIEPNSVGFEEENKTLGIKISVSYFTTTHKPYAGLVRKVVLTNLDDAPKRIELLDGLMTVWPYKNDNFVTKNMSNLAVAWFEVFNHEINLPFYRNRSTTSDSAAIGNVEAGHFYAAYANTSSKALPILYDPDVIFGNHTSLLKPRNFEKFTLSQMLAMDSVAANKLPCAFAAYSGQLESEMVLTSIAGKMDHLDQLKETSKVFCTDYFLQMERSAFEMGESLTHDVKGKTAHPIFDAYVRQSYLDNLLRGGYPVLFEGKEKPIVYHVYSRIHGDMEREYNDFYVEPAFYSHGNGNYRDVNQNRRNDVYFVKEAGLFNIKQFMDLLQMDGQNPLVIKGSTFTISNEDRDWALQFVVDQKEVVSALLDQSFTPGALMRCVTENGVVLSESSEAFVKHVLSRSEQHNDAAYGHGFWVDHWTYNMDLIDNYLNVFPDKLESLLFDGEYKYFQSPDVVLARKDKFVLTEEGKVRQYDALYRDKRRMKALDLDPNRPNWHKTKSGNIYRSSLATKLIVLVANKVTNFDPSGIGIMMNADKPGWNDAMNGLPGLFGSGLSEVVELKRVVDLLIGAFSRIDRPLELPEEIAILLNNYEKLLVKLERDEVDALRFWELVQDTKEAYLKLIEANLSGVNVTLSTKEMLLLLNRIEEICRIAIEKGIEIGGGILISYLTHEAVSFDVIDGKKHPINGMQNVKITEWLCRPLPRYLEGPARYLKSVKDKETALQMYHEIASSGMYDDKLKMYITSESLEDETHEIGRARAFSPGWLERESNFMHMSYKYLLGVLKAGLYDEFFKDIKTSFPPFMDPVVYGRSTLENSSFIASSRNPNPQNHGRGFVSRLTGTTAEMISIWIHMMFGTKIFSFDGELSFRLCPVLSAEFFDDNDEVRATLFGATEIVYRNPKRIDTFGEGGVKPMAFTLHYKNGKMTFSSEPIRGEMAYDIRNGEIATIIVDLDV